MWTLARVPRVSAEQGFSLITITAVRVREGGAVYLGMYWVLANKIGGTLQYPSPGSKY